MKKEAEMGAVGSLTIHIEDKYMNEGTQKVLNGRTQFRAKVLDFECCDPYSAHFSPIGLCIQCTCNFTAV